MLKILFNYYNVLKACWIILLFQVVGYFALVNFEQGSDILRSLGFNNGFLASAHTLAALLAALWWSWQSWRAARVELHFTTFEFRSFSTRFALQAQVLIPRLLGVTPLLILLVGLVRSTSWANPLVYLVLSLVIWMYVFYHLRKDIIVWLMSKHTFWSKIPDYIIIKNDAYPAAFIWAKQSRWIILRLSLILLFFAAVFFFPVDFPQLLGSSAIVLFALGAWQIIGSLIDFAEKHFRFPFSFTVILMVVLFSRWNNNHEIRSLGQSQYVRQGVEAHFTKWYEEQSSFYPDSVPVVLVASQGGGVRSSYWTAQVLAQLSTDLNGFDSSIYAYSTVSGGSLGVAAYKLSEGQGEERAGQIRRILNKDFLAPVTSWLVMPDLLQKFLPFPIKKFDRAKVLERSWEEAAQNEGSSYLSSGFLQNTFNDRSMYLYHSAHAENGLTTLISNVVVDQQVFGNKEDLMDVISYDIPHSTAVSISSRFPFMTPPAVVCQNDETWGHLVDGGYVENMGSSSLLELYAYLNKLSVEKGFKTKFLLVFIKNTKEESYTPIGSMHELVAPLNTLSKVWVNKGNYEDTYNRLKYIGGHDKAIFVSLDRSDDQVIPLGWFLSERAIEEMDRQLIYQTREIKEAYNNLLSQ